MITGRKLSIGYHAGDFEGLGCSWSRGVAAYRGFVSEVFFPLPGMVSGVRQSDFADGETATRFYRDLSRLRAMDVNGVLLLDAACYGGDVVFESFFRLVERGVRTVQDAIHLKAVVTMTPPLAEFLKKAFPKLEIRASVNERIGFVNQMEYAGRCYDGFYLKSDVCRDIRLVEKARQWCDVHGKTLHLVANNGCLYECPFLLEHLNTMGHQTAIAAGGSAWNGRAMQCREVLTEAANRVQILQGCWIRPEDLGRMEGFFDTIALLSNDIEQALKVLKAYTEGRWDGDLLELLEPCHAGVAGLPPLRNDAFPSDWFDKTSTCGHMCDGCGYCAEILCKMDA
jgi:hypothetical protein